MITAYIDGGSRGNPGPAGYGVQIVADAVTSRTQANWRLAMDYLRQAGAVVTTSETALFQLLRQADSDDFRELARLIR